jgi:pimeloyl-ACP methyl ester carboxylesterase
MSTETIEYCQPANNGVRLGYVSRGSGPLVIFLHGFPDTYRGFLPILDIVAAAGFRAVALAMRGYEPSARAPNNDYRVEALASDVIGVADALGSDRFYVVGHDWGASAAYATAILAPERVIRIVTAAVPHTGHFLLSARLRQLRRSHYMLRFQAPWWAEYRLPRDDFAWIEKLIRVWSPSWKFGEAEMRPLKHNFGDPRRLKAAIAYYRQMSASLVSPLSRRLVFGKVTVPTRIIFGLQDGCIGPEMFDGQQHHFTAGLDLRPMVDAGHFMQWEQPERFARLVIDYIASA